MTNVLEDLDLKAKRWVFRDRTDAGRRLVPFLTKWAAREAIVLAIPSGGVPVGLEVATAMSLPFDLVIARKLPIPGNPEAGFGAVTLDGNVFLNESMVQTLGLTPPQIEASVGVVKKQIGTRNRIFRQGRPPPSVRGRAAILIDDGLASGYTMLASINSIKRGKAKEIVVAVPTAPNHSVQKIAPLVNQMVCLNIREGPYFAVAEAYQNWDDLSEDEVLAYLKA